ncbi:MAG: sugar phosphate isomerase/epimerase [Alphaproteobacteria bacterium]|nr:sugar phosphate isomerase/epimerase [Alphaproteobacteria bacterium]
MRFGAASWPFQWDPPYETAIRRIAGLGFKAIELIAWNKDYLKDYYTPAKIKELRGVLKEEGIALSQFVSTPHDLSSGEKAKRDAAVEHWQRAVEVGAELGSKIINMVSSHGFAMRDGQEVPRITTKPLVQKYSVKLPSGLDWDRNYDDYVEALKRCAAACEKADVSMSIEPHPGRYVANTDGALRLLEHVGSKAVGINFDPSHTFPVGDFPNVTVYRLGKRILHCHVSDNDGVTNVHWRPGMGKIDWVAMFQALKDIGYDGTISVELEDVPGVSRGPNSTAPGVYRHPTATDEFVAETVAGMNYLKGICKDIGIPVQ